MSKVGDTIVIEQLAEVIKKAEEVLKQLQAECTVLIAKVEKQEKEVKQWSPVGGDFYVNSFGKTVYLLGASDIKSKEFGLERPTEKQAERAAVEMRRFNRLLALRDELCGDDAELGIYHVIFQNRDGTYFMGYSEQQNNKIGSVRFTTKESAQRACEMLNSGEVEL
jgi:hypothetical protein